MIRLRTPQLDFLVLGAQKAGTTTLWRLLEDHPGLRMPPAKESPIFSEPGYPDALRSYLRALFRDAPRGARLGTVTPVYLVGTPAAPVPLIAERIRETAPGVRLVALLRDPVDRARSAHRMAVRRGHDTRSFEAAVDELLTPAALAEGRERPVETSSYVTAGEYGRMLGAYLEHFPREQLHLELADDLARDPQGVVDRVCAFLGVDRHVPSRLGERANSSGPRRVSEEAERDLLGYLDRHVWPRMRHAEQHREAFEFFFGLWNVEPAAAPPPPPDDTAARRLRAHYAEDLRHLDALTGLGVAQAWGVNAR